MSDSKLIFCPDEHRGAGRAPDLPAAASRRQRFEPEASQDGKAAPHHLPALISPPLGVARSQLADSATWSGIELRVHGDLAEVADVWRSFENEADRTVFQAFDWIAKWQRHIGAPRGTLPAVVVGRDADGQILCILPFAIETRGLVRCLSWLGAELCDYNAPLLCEHFAQAVSPARFALLWDDVIDLLSADARFRFDLVDLQKMPETAGEQPNPFLQLQVLAHPSGAYVAHLGRTWEKFYAAKRSASTRKRERRQLKHLAEHGELRYVNVEERADLERTLAALIEQKSRAFARMGVEDLFARPGYRAFYQDVATDPQTRALAHVSRLDVGATTAATNLGLKFRDCYYLVLSSYHDGEISRFGPGRAHLNELLRHAIDSGFERFDFTVGDEPYKRDWSDTELRLYDYLAAVTFRGWVVVASKTAYRRAKRHIKQTPALWHAFSKARALAGLISRR
jgi:CelD/BcsL family acetyltransferase involved in cellulose biosynthesis